MRINPSTTFGRTMSWLMLFALLFGSPSTYGSGRPGNRGRHKPLPGPVPGRRPQPKSFDPVRFVMQLNTKDAALQQEIEVTIIAQLLDVPPNLVTIFEESKSFSIKVLKPEGFVQTGGSYYDYAGASLSAGNRQVRFTLRGHFENFYKTSCFRLLRGPANSHAGSSFILKSTVCVNPPEDQQFSATRMQACAFSAVATAGTLLCVPAGPAPVTVRVSGPATNVYTYSWTGPGVNNVQSLEEKVLADTIVRNTPQAGIKKDTAVKALLFRPGFTVPAGGDYAGNISSGGQRRTKLLAQYPGTYTVTIRDSATGCQASATAMLQYQVYPTVAINGAVPLTCAKTALTLRASGSSGVTYAWSGPGVAGTGKDSLKVTAPGSYAVTVTSTVNGCTATASSLITQNTTLPTVTLNGGLLSCQPTALLLKPLTVSPSNVTFSWRGPGVDSTSANVPVTDTLTVRTLGIYKLTVRNPLNGCVASDTALVKTNPTCLDYACSCTDCDLPELSDTDYPEVTASNAGSPGVNYVIENTFLKDDGSSVAQSVTYLDGLGRVYQKVNARAGGYSYQNRNPSDLVQPVVYDVAGREARKYLSFSWIGALPGQFVANVVSRQATYYASTLGRAGNAYSDITYENSPLSRVLAQKAAGSAVAVSFVYRTNTAGEVKRLDYNSANSHILVKDYDAGRLNVTAATDENGNVTMEYKDLSGQLVCKNVSGRKTYYCYDDLGQLRCVLPPNAAGQLASADFDPLASELLFTYSYNDRGLMVSKKVPGAGKVTITYNNRDLVETLTDAKGQITTTSYDGINRQVSVRLGTDEIAHYYYDSYPSENFNRAHAFGVARRVNVKGLPTASDQKILGTATMLRSNTYYDELGKTIQVVSQNHKGSTDTSSMKVDFAGRVLETRLSTLNKVVVSTRTSYDRGGRTKAVCQRVSDATTGSSGAYWEPVGRYSYNGIGELTTKNLGCNIQKVDYAYNMRGWMTGINNPAQLSNPANKEKDFFGMALGYDAVGNITTWDYRSAQRTGAYPDAYAITPKEPFAYSFTYDNLQRIKSADLTKSGNAVFAMGGAEGGKMGYDDNGNILSLSRTYNGAVVDNLAYTYPANSNRLGSVTDNGANPSTPNEFFASNSSYTYDANGNLVTDSGKGITAITYNHLNLPQTVTKSGQGIVSSYTSEGTKLKANFGANKVYDYVAGLVYVNDSLEFIPTSEGRLLPPGRAINPQLNANTAAPAGVTGKFYRYEYQINDHLGNLRVACRCGEKAGAVSPNDAYAPVVLQENHYDPWGLGLPLNAENEKVGGSPNDRFTYNGKEKQKDLGWFDYGARMYDAQVGRWGGVDPLAEKWGTFSPYSFTLNNPTNLIDPDGMDVEDLGDRISYTGKDKDNLANSLGIGSARGDEHEVNGKTGEKKLMSDLGGKDIDFNHYTGGERNGQTEIINKETGDIQWMNSSNFLKSYMRRTKYITYSNIFSEFMKGTGPEKSLIYGADNPMIQNITESAQFAKAFLLYRRHGKNNKFYFGGQFGLDGVATSGINMTSQMLGKASFSFYPVGNRLVIMVADSKSATSWSLNPFVKGEHNNIPRTNGYSGPQSTTHQTYIWYIPLK